MAACFEWKLHVGVVVGNIGFVVHDEEFDEGDVGAAAVFLVVME